MGNFSFSEKATGTEMAGRPAKLAGIVITSFMYSSRGERPAAEEVEEEVEEEGSLKATEGLVGVRRTSTPREEEGEEEEAEERVLCVRKTLSKSSFTSRRICCAFK
jgi:hypothetical protein